MAGYKPQANLPFVAVYIAQTNGYFAQQGLQVDIQHASGNGEHLKLLLQGSEDVITASGDEILARRSEGLPVVSIAVLGQRNQRALAVRAESDIKTPKTGKASSSASKSSRPLSTWRCWRPPAWIDRKSARYPSASIPGCSRRAPSTSIPCSSRTSRTRCSASACPRACSVPATMACRASA